MSAFTELLKKTLSIEREHRKLTSLAGSKLSAKAFLADAVTFARSDLKALAALRRELEGGGAGLDAARAALRKTVAAVRSPNFPWVPSDPSRLRYLGSDAALAELAMVHSTLPMLFAVAVLVATERHPESFGPVEDHQAWAQRVAELERIPLEFY